MTAARMSVMEDALNLSPLAERGRRAKRLG
jgi:hypothetical protein